MSKPYTESDFGSQLAEDRTWRIREMSDLKAAILRADAISQKVLLRALIAICYAHWEGHAKFAAAKYLGHIALRRLPFRDLDRQFTRNHFLRRLAALASSKSSLADRCAIVDQILESASIRFARVDEDLVGTHSNLNYDVLRDICVVCGIPSEPFEQYKTFIDVILLKRRNAIAHGEDTFVGIGDLDQVVDKTIELMRLFGDAVENQIYLKRYRAAS
jgi:MAE_28990/MAE_18760-like HEPN